jgi:hypothetical protein
VNSERRVPPDDRASRARVIEVDMRENQVAQVLQAQAVSLQARLEGAQARRRAAVDERGLASRKEV